MIQVSLVISNSSIKILSLKGRQVNQWGNIALKTKQVHDGQIIEPQPVAEAIRELFKTTGIRKEAIAVSLAGLSFTYRFVSLPKMKPELLEEAIKRAAKKEMSLPLEEMYLSWCSVPGKANEQSFFVLGVSRNLIDAAVKTFDLAGIEPYTLELQPLALARMANRRDAIAVSLEPDCFNIVFIADGIPQVIHTISPRGEGATLEDNIRRLADELTKTAAFYQSSHPASRLSAETPLLITGDLAVEATAGALLQAEVEYPITPMDPPVDFPPEAPAAAYTIGAGLALNYTTRKSTARTKEGFYDININILSGKYRKSRAKPVSSSMIWLGILLAAAIIFLFPLHQSLNRIKTENAALENELRRVSVELNIANLVSGDAAAAEETIESTINNTLELKKANFSILSARGTVTHDLEAVTSACPPILQLTQVEINSSSINLRGEADNVFTVIDYAKALEAVPFPEVRITRLDETAPRATDSDDVQNSTETANLIIFEIVIKK